MSPHLCENISYLLIALIGLHIVHFVITYYVRVGKVQLERQSDHNRSIVVRHQEMILRTACHFILVTCLLWFLCGPIALALAAAASLAHMLIDYWCQKVATSTSKVFWAKAGVGNLFYNLLYASLACSAYALNHF